MGTSASRAEVVDRNVDGRRNAACREFRGSAHVDDLRIRRLRGELIRGDLWMIAAEHSCGDETGHVDRIFRRAELWRVGEFHLFEVVDGEARLDGDRQHVDAFVDAGATGHLSARMRPESGAKSSLIVMPWAPG